jgi:hypothetical protein
MTDTLSELELLLPQPVFHISAIQERPIRLSSGKKYGGEFIYVLKTPIKIVLFLNPPKNLSNL